MFTFVVIASLTLAFSLLCIAALFASLVMRTEADGMLPRAWAELCGASTYCISAKYLGNPCKHGRLEPQAPQAEKLVL
jgi:hypothetical protein